MRRSATSPPPKSGPKIGHPDRWKDYWLDPETKLVQFIGKDNIPFHAVFFPAMLMGQDQPYKLPDEIPANEFLLLEGRQFSKSEGWTIDLEDFFTRYTPDQIRYAIAANAPETSDSEFSWKDFQIALQRRTPRQIRQFRPPRPRLRQAALPLPKSPQRSPTADQFPEDQMNQLVDGGSAHSYSNFHLRKASQTAHGTRSARQRLFRRAKNLGRSPKIPPTRRTRNDHRLLHRVHQKSRSRSHRPSSPPPPKRSGSMLGYHDRARQGQLGNHSRNPCPHWPETSANPKSFSAKWKTPKSKSRVAKLGQITQSKDRPLRPPPTQPLKDTDRVSIRFDKLDLRVGANPRSGQSPQVEKAPQTPRRSRL